MNPARGLVLVKAVTTAETLGGGQIIIPVKSREAMTAHQMIVVDVGLAEICDDEDCRKLHVLADNPAPVAFFGQPYGVGLAAAHPTDDRIKPGAWVLVRPRSLVDAGVPTERLYFVRQDEVLGVFETS